MAPGSTEQVGRSDRTNPIAVLMEEIERLAEDASWAGDVDIVLIHRGVVWPQTTTAK